MGVLLFLTSGGIIAQKFQGGNGGGYSFFQSQGNPLPISYLNLNLSNKQSFVSIEWRTSLSEKLRFEIERKDGYGQWENILDVYCTENCSSKEFNVVDETQLVSITYYRVCEYDFNEVKNCSNISHLSPLNVDVEIMAYPNPVTSLLHIETKSGANWNNFKVLDNTGAIILSGSYTNLIDCINLEKGIYFLQINSSSAYSKTLKFIKF